MGGGMKQELIEFDLYIAPDGTEYTLADGSTAFLLGQGGLGMPPITYLTERGPLQHGVTPTGYRLEPRLVQALHRKNGNNRSEFWENRATILNALRPNRQAANAFTTGVLRKILQNGETRDLNVLIERGPEFGMRDPKMWDEWGFTEILRFLAFDPVFFDPTDKSLTFSLAGLVNLVFPITFPITFGAAVINDTQLINYLGTWLEYPVIEVDGPMEGPAIYNDTTDEYIQVSYNVASGDTLVIDLADRRKTVTNNAGDDLQGTVEGDLGSWHLAPDPEAAGGVNTIRVTGSEAAPSTTRVRLTYHDRYIGL